MLTRRVLVAVTLCVATRAQAQAIDSVTKASPASPVARKTMLTLNPFAAFAGFFTAELERALSSSVSLGASGSFTADNDFNDYASLEGKVRYYPNEKVLQGFSIAASLGVATARDNIFTSSGYVATNGSSTTVYSAEYSDRITRATIGMDLSYQWLLGPQRKFAIVLGGGLKRFFGQEGYFDPFASPVIPTARLNLGFAF